MRVLVSPLATTEGCVSRYFLWAANGARGKCERARHEVGSKSDPPQRITSLLPPPFPLRLVVVVVVPTATHVHPNQSREWRESVAQAAPRACHMANFPGEYQPSGRKQGYGSGTPERSPRHHIVNLWLPSPILETHLYNAAILCRKFVPDNAEWPVWRTTLILGTGSLKDGSDGLVVAGRTLERRVRSQS
jgi:hypothetical protein